MDINPFLLTDFYKVGHPFQYPKGTTKVYSNFTPRSSRIPGVKEVVFFGLQYFLKEYLVYYFNRNFFRKQWSDIKSEYSHTVRTCLGTELPTYQHLRAVHDLGYLPVQIKALPEGSRCPLRVPCLTIQNTKPEFYWLTNFLESLMSCILWQPITSATIADRYHDILSKYATFTGMPQEFVQWQGHDFSFRGMSSLESVILSGMGHLTSFTGTDSIPAIKALEKYYWANGLIGGSVPATEHSVMCAGGHDDELETFRRLITEVYPTGIVSIVSDTWDLWKVCNEYLPALKDIILARDGKVVIRPDSGDPVKIICGDQFSSNPYASKGVVELLWDVFGGTETSEGFKVLDPRIGVIYGDSITVDRADEICGELYQKGFASQVVFGIGSYTYQYNTRDTFGFAMKATYIEHDGVGQNIYKNPVTDDGTKKSATGLLCVRDGVLYEDVSKEEESIGDLQTVFLDGQITRQYTLEEIRKRIRSKYEKQEDEATPTPHIY